MRGDEGESFARRRRQQCRDRAFGPKAINEPLRRDEATRKGDVELPLIRLSPQLDGCLLDAAIAKIVVLIHVDRGDAIGEHASLLWTVREVHPAKILDGGAPCGEVPALLLSLSPQEAQAIREGVVLLRLRLPILDREPDKVLWRLTMAPVHRQERHPFPAIHLQCKRRSGVLALHLE